MNQMNGNLDTAILKEAWFKANKDAKNQKTEQLCFLLKSTDFKTKFLRKLKKLKPGEANITEFKIKFKNTKEKSVCSKKKTTNQEKV